MGRVPEYVIRIRMGLKQTFARAKLIAITRRSLSYSLPHIGGRRVSFERV